MNRKKIFAILGLTMALTVTGCGSSTSKETEAAAADTAAEAADTNASAEDADADDVDADDSAEDADDADDADSEFTITDAEDSDEEETEASLDPITPSDYLISNASDYVTLADLDGLPATEYVYEVTDDDVQDEIDQELSSYSEEVEVDRASVAGDVVSVDMTATVEGDDEEDAETESTYFTIGEEEYNAEFDEQLTGVSAGDTLDFSITFDDNIWMDEWVNQTVNFHIAVTGVSEVSVPDFDDAFVSEYTDYETTEEYEAYIREMLESDNEDTSYYETVTSLFETAVSMSDFSDDYPEELYTSCREEVLSFYSMFTGSDDEEDIYDLFGISSEDIDDEALDTVKQRLLISAIAQEQSIEVTEDEYVEFVTTYAGYYGYSSAVEFEEDNTRDALVWAMYETKVGDYLYDNATIVEETYSGDESGLEEIEFDTEEDVEEDITDVETEAISEAE